MSDRRTARLQLIAFINAMPLTAELRLEVDDIGRLDFDMIAAEEQVSHRGRFRKEVTLGPGHRVDVLCAEPPASVIAYPTRTRADLRLLPRDEATALDLSPGQIENPMIGLDDLGVDFSHGAMSRRRPGKAQDA